MDRQAYRKELEHVKLTQEQMDALAERMAAPPVKQVRHVGRMVLAAAVLTGLLSMAALAVSPTLQEAISHALGSFEPYSQAVDGRSAMDQGIEVRVVNALSDGITAQVYYEMQDMTGDRLDQFLYNRLYLIPADFGTISWHAASGGNDQMIQYDPESKTALFRARIVGDGPPAEHLVLDFRISQIRPGVHYVESAVDPAWIPEGTLQTEVLENGKTVLAPNQTVRPLEGGYFALSSFGFGEDGVLHFQVRVDADTSQWDWDWCGLSFGGASRSDTAPYYPRTNRYNQTRDTAGMTEEEKRQTDPETRFLQDGVLYWDIRTGITPADVAEGDVAWYEKAAAFLHTRPAIEGEWRLEVPVETVEQLQVDMAPSNTAAAINGVAAQTLHLSVLGCTLESDPNGTPDTLGYPLTVYRADGTTVPAIPSDGFFQMGSYAVDHWSYDEPIQPEEVIAIAIGQWYIPIRDGCAQPGHWLDKLPE